jgi:hypothetical protein
MLKLKSWQLGTVVLVLIFGGVMVTSAFGWWQTESTKVPVKYETGEAAGEYNPVDIRGSYTFADISSLFEIPYEDLATAFHLPADADPETIACKDLEEMYLYLAESGTEIGTASVRLFVALYKGLPYDLDAEEETYLLRPGVQLLKRKTNLTEAQLAFLDAHSVDLQDGETAAAAPETQESAAQDAAAEDTFADPQAASTPVPASEEHAESSDRMVKGPTTFREVLDWGVPQETIEQIIGGPMPNPLTVIKDYCSAQGLAFGEIKTALQAEVDAVE